MQAGLRLDYQLSQNCLQLQRAGELGENSLSWLGVLQLSPCHPDAEPALSSGRSRRVCELDRGKAGSPLGRARGSWVTYHPHAGSGLCCTPAPPSARVSGPLPFLQNSRVYTGQQTADRASEKDPGLSRGRVIRGSVHARRARACEHTEAQTHTRLGAKLQGLTSLPD